MNRASENVPIALRGTDMTMPRTKPNTPDATVKSPIVPAGSTEDTFLTPSTKMLIGAGVIGGVMTTVGLMAALPVASIIGVTIAASGAVGGGVNTWLHRETAPHSAADSEQIDDEDPE